MMHAAAFLALVLTACGTPEAPGSGQGNGPGTARAPADSEDAPPLSDIRLTSRTPFTLPAIEAAFPDFEVISIAETADTLPAFHVRRAGDMAALYMVTPDWTRGLAGAVSTRHSDVPGPGGIRAGVSHLEDVPEADRANCAAPAPAGEFSLICESGALRLEFTGTGDNPTLAQQTWRLPLPE